jgi:hypothetical protein
MRLPNPTLDDKLTFFPRGVLHAGMVADWGSDCLPPFVFECGGIILYTKCHDLFFGIQFQAKEIWDKALCKLLG